MSSPWFVAAAAALVAVVAATLVVPQEARSQAAVRTYIPLGSHATGPNNTTSQAWFIDAAERKVIVCVQPAAPAATPPGAAASVPRPSCSSAPIP